MFFLILVMKFNKNIYVPSVTFHYIQNKTNYTIVRGLRLFYMGYKAKAKVCCKIKASTYMNMGPTPDKNLDIRVTNDLQC